MAVTSIWRVHGSVGKVLDYVENAEKTTAVSTGDSDLSDVIDYAIQQHKTSQTQVRDGEEVVQRFVSGINCHPSTAGMEMQKVKKFYGKEDGVIAYHGYQSFAPGEATPEIAHEIGVKLARQLWGDRYQVLVATHLDRANHLHSHFVINTVSFVDGIKYHRTKQDYKEMQRVSDALCKEYGLSVIRNPKGRGMTYNEWIAEKEGKPTLRGVIRSDIDRAILASTTQQNFQEAMQAMGYTFKTRAPDGQPLKYPALNPPGAKGYFRFHRLGSGYSLTEILDRVYDNVRRQTPFPEADRMAKQRNPFIPYPKAKGIHALYLRYCYELRIIQKHPASVKRVPYSMRQDLILLLYLGGNEQSTHEYVSKLLGKQTIDTNTYGQSKGRSGSYTTNFQTAGRELMTPDEVRMLDNRYSLLFIRGERPVKDLKYNILKHPNVALTTDGQAAAYQHGTDPLSVAAVSINLEKLKQAASEDTGTGDYVVLTEEEVYDFMRRKAQENNQNQNSNHQEETYEKHHQQYHPPHHPSYF